MTTVKEFQEWLNQFPPETEVQVTYQQPSSMYESYGPVIYSPIDLPDKTGLGNGYEYVDYSNNKYVRPPDVRSGRKILYLGES